MAIKSAPLSPSIRALMSATHLASDRVSEGQASTATAQSTLLPRDCLALSSYKGKHSVAETAVLSVALGAATLNRAESPSWAPRTRRPISFLHDPQGAQQHSVQQVPGSGSACRPSNWQALHRCQSKDVHRARRAGFVIRLAGEMLTCWRLPWDVPNAVEVKQAEFGAEPEITIGRLSN